MPAIRSGSVASSVVIAPEVIEHLQLRQSTLKAKSARLEIGLVCGEVQNSTCCVQCVTSVPIVTSPRIGAHGEVEGHGHRIPFPMALEVLDENRIRSYIGSVQRILCGLTVVLGVYSIASPASASAYRESLKVVMKLVSMSLSASMMSLSLSAILITIPTSTFSVSVFSHSLTSAAGSVVEALIPHKIERLGTDRLLVDVSASWNVKCFTFLKRDTNRKTIRGLYQLIEKVIVNEIEKIQSALVVREDDDSEAIVDETRRKGSLNDVFGSKSSSSAVGDMLTSSSSTSLSRSRRKTNALERREEERKGGSEEEVVRKSEDEKLGCAWKQQPPHQRYRLLSASAYKGGESEFLVRQSATGMLRIEGTISGRARVPSINLDANAAAALKFDLVRTLFARVDIMFDGVANVGGAPAEPRKSRVHGCIYAEYQSSLPHRVLLKTDEVSLSQCAFCGYIMADDDDVENQLAFCRHQFCSLMQIPESDVSMEAIEECDGQVRWQETDLVLAMRQTSSSRRGRVKRAMANVVNKQLLRLLICIAWMMVTFLAMTIAHVAYFYD